MELAETNIYPLNEINLQALLDHFFKGFVTGDISTTMKDLERSGLTLKELEDASARTQLYIPMIKSQVNSILTQTNLLSYAIEIFIDEKWTKRSTPSSARLWVISQVKAKAL